MNADGEDADISGAGRRHLMNEVFTFQTPYAEPADEEYDEPGKRRRICKRRFSVTGYSRQGFWIPFHRVPRHTRCPPRR